MRTTVSLDDEHYEEARRIAFETRRTLGDVINELIGSGLQQRRAAATKRSLGSLRGTITIAEDFDATDEDIVDTFEADL